MAKELSTTVKPHSRPMMNRMKPLLPSVLSALAAEVVFLAGEDTSSIFLDTACKRDFISVTACEIGLICFYMAFAVAAFDCNKDSILVAVSL